MLLFFNCEFKKQSFSSDSCLLFGRVDGVSWHQERYGEKVGRTSTWILGESWLFSTVWSPWHLHPFLCLQVEVASISGKERHAVYSFSVPGMFIDTGLFPIGRATRLERWIYVLRGAVSQGGREVWMLSCILIITGMKNSSNMARTLGTGLGGLSSALCSVTNQLGDPVPSLALRASQLLTCLLTL